MNTSEHRAGFVNIIGNPNVGKSTLMNRLVGERISVITSKAQTTRHRIKGIVNGDNYQIVYSDLPGVLKPAYRMQKMMMRFVLDSLQDADIILYMTECGETKFNELLLNKIKALQRPVLLIINKIDKYTAEQIASSETFWKAVLPEATLFSASALKGIHMEELRQKIIDLLPVCPPYFPKDQLTDRPVRFFVSELIRERILLQYQKEIPYSVEVVIDSYREDNDIVRIEAILYVERETQKVIIVGRKGMAIKKLGIEARHAIEDYLQKHVFLDLSVKVLKEWRNNELQMRKFGYDLSD